MGNVNQTLWFRAGLHTSTHETTTVGLHIRGSLRTFTGTETTKTNVSL